MSHADKWVLYVARDSRDRQRYCPGSAVCMRLIARLELENAIQVQDADVLRRSSALPDFLRGTPTLLSRDSRELFKGTEAVEEIAAIARARRSSERARVVPDIVAERRNVHIPDEDDEGGTSMHERDQGWPKPKTTAAPPPSVSRVEQEEEMSDFAPLVDEVVDDTRFKSRKISDEDVQRELRSRGM